MAGERALTLAAMLGCGRLGFTDASLEAKDAADPDVPACTAGQSNLAIASDLDDGEIAVGIGMLWLPSGEAMDGGRSFIGFWDMAPIYGYFRFALPAIPLAAQITSARLTLTAGTVGGTAGRPWDPSSDAIRIEIEDTVAATQVQAGAECPGCPSGRAIAPASVRWPATGGLAWPAPGNSIMSPELATIVDAVFTAHSGQPRTALQLWLRGENIPTNDDTEVSYSDFANGPAGSVGQLAISWKCP
jgi:hypothetical protein